MILWADNWTDKCLTSDFKSQELDGWEESQKVEVTDNITAIN